MQDGNGEVGVEARITFVIPAYNAEKTLERTLDSILWQTDGRYRVVIVDDGSTDRTGRSGRDMPCGIRTGSGISIRRIKGRVVPGIQDCGRWKRRMCLFWTVMTG